MNLLSLVARLYVRLHRDRINARVATHQQNMRDQHLTLEEAWMLAETAERLLANIDEPGDRQGCDPEAPCWHSVGWTCTMHQPARGKHHAPQCDLPDPWDSRWTL